MFSCSVSETLNYLRKRKTGGNKDKDKESREQEALDFCSVWTDTKQCDVAVARKSFKKWRKIKTFQDFQSLSYQFSLGKLYVPWYFGSLANDPSNPHLKDKGVKLFQRINKLGLSTENSQESSEKNQQRGFISGLTTVDIASSLCESLNKIDGLIAFYSPSNPKKTDNIIEHLWVTYDLDKPFTRFIASDVLDYVKDVNKPLFRTIKNDPNVVAFSAIDTLRNRKQKYFLAKTIVNILKTVE